MLASFSLSFGEKLVTFGKRSFNLLPESQTACILEPWGMRGCGLPQQTVLEPSWFPRDTHPQIYLVFSQLKDFIFLLSSKIVLQTSLVVHG